MYHAGLRVAVTRLIGGRSNTPGEVVKVKGNTITVRLATGQVRDFLPSDLRPLKVPIRKADPNKNLIDEEATE